MIKNGALTMAKKITLPDVVCKVEKSGNRYNAWSTDGTKYTSEITHGCRKNAFKGDYLIGRFPSTNGNKGTSWRKITDKVSQHLGEISDSKNTPSTNDNVSIGAVTSTPLAYFACLATSFPLVGRYGNLQTFLFIHL